MSGITRRDCLQTSVKVLGGTALAAATASEALAGPDRKPYTQKPGIHFAHVAGRARPRVYGS